MRPALLFYIKLYVNAYSITTIRKLLKCQKMLLLWVHSDRKRQNWHVTYKAKFLHDYSPISQSIQSGEFFIGAVGQHNHHVHMACSHQRPLHLLSHFNAMTSPKGR